MNSEVNSREYMKEMTALENFTGRAEKLLDHATVIISHFNLYFEKLVKSYYLEELKN